MKLAHAALLPTIAFAMASAPIQAQALSGRTASGAPAGENLTGSFLPYLLLAALAVAAAIIILDDDVNEVPTSP